MSEAQTLQHNTTRLTWDEIRRAYPEQFVILVDFVLDTTQPHPKEAVVFACATDKKQLLATTKQALVGKTRGIFFTGQHKGGALY